MKERYFLGIENSCNNGEWYYFQTHMLQTQVGTINEPTKKYSYCPSIRNCKVNLNISNYL